MTAPTAGLMAPKTAPETARGREQSMGIFTTSRTSRTSRSVGSKEEEEEEEKRNRKNKKETKKTKTKTKTKTIRIMISFLTLVWCVTAMMMMMMTMMTTTTTMTMTTTTFNFNFNFTTTAAAGVPAGVPAAGGAGPAGGGSATRAGGSATAARGPAEGGAVAGGSATRAGSAAAGGPATAGSTSAAGPAGPATTAGSATTAGGDGGYFSACMLTMDDNHFMVEWLAYHYHVLPLRRIVLLVDPKSKTSPLPVLERWNGRINYTVWDIKDVYPPDGRPPGLAKNDPVPLSVRLYVRLQSKFIEKCLLYLKDEAEAEAEANDKKEANNTHTHTTPTWVLATDVDEYTMVNEHTQHRDHPLYEYVQNQTKKHHTKHHTSNHTKHHTSHSSHSSSTNTTTSTNNSHNHHHHQKTTTDTTRTRTIDYSEPGYIWKALNVDMLRAKNQRPGQQEYGSPCVPITRKHFGPVERHEQRQAMEEYYQKFYQHQQAKQQANKKEPPIADRWNANVSYTNTNTTSSLLLPSPSSFPFDVSSFQTTNFKLYRPSMYLAGKAMVDVSRVDRDVLTRNEDPSVHLPVEYGNVCTRKSMWLEAHDNVFVANHYMGTLRQMQFRSNDSRGGGGGGGGNSSSTNTTTATATTTASATATTSGEDYRTARYYQSKKELIGGVESDRIDSWIRGFVRSVGVDEATRLLHGVGDPDVAAENAWVVGVAPPTPAATPAGSDNTSTDPTDERHEIPKVLHFVHVTPGFPTAGLDQPPPSSSSSSSSLPTNIQTNIDNWQKLHPDYDVIVWNNTLARRHYPDIVGKLTNVTNATSLSRAAGNLIRYRALEEFGGICLDTDMIPVRSIDELRKSVSPLFTVCQSPIVDPTEFGGTYVIPTEECRIASSAVIGIIPHAPVMKHIVKVAQRNTFHFVSNHPDGDAEIPPWTSGSPRWTKSLRKNFGGGTSGSGSGSGALGGDSRRVHILRSQTFFPCPSEDDLCDFVPENFKNRTEYPHTYAYTIPEWSQS